MRYAFPPYANPDREPHHMDGPCPTPARFRRTQTPPNAP